MSNCVYVNVILLLGVGNCTRRWIKLEWKKIWLIIQEWSKIICTSHQYIH